MVGLFLGAIAISFAIFSLGFAAYYWGSYLAGQNLFREFIVVYRQVEETREVEVNDRIVEQRSYRMEALPETTRLELILPPLLINNVLLALVLSALAIRYSHRFAGPLYRISTDIRRVLAGEQDVRIRLRKNDELRELGARINALLQALERAERRDQSSEE
jgi:nitrogen fixation/metabolism regulation signal transduction histidine kinase